MKVAVITEAREPITADNVSREKRIDWHNSSDRKWLMSHMHFCMMNNRSVTLSPESN